MWSPLRNRQSDQRDHNRRDRNTEQSKKPAWQLVGGDSGGHGSSLLGDDPTLGAGRLAGMRSFANVRAYV